MTWSTLSRPGTNPGRVSFTTAKEAARGPAAPTRMTPRRPSGQRARGSGSVGLWPECGGRAASFRGAQWVCRAALFCTVTGVPFAPDTA
jgi:hypothetical protein